MLNNASAVCDWSVPMDSPDRDERMIEAARRIVPSWKGVRSDDVTVTQISGGITNLLFKLSVRGHDPLLVRLYGTNTDIMIDRMEENRVFAELSKVNFAPTYYGQFEGGRIEGWIEARPLEPEQLSQQSPVNFVKLIACETARLHSLLKPRPSGPPPQPILFRKIDEWVRMALAVEFDDPVLTSELTALKLGDLAKEVKWLEDHLVHNPPAPASDAERAARDFLLTVVFSHQDLLAGNILHGPGVGKDRVQFIDFEYGGYNFRAFDIANHFAEHAGFDSNYETGYPTLETEKAFVKAYVTAARGKLDTSDPAVLDALVDVVNRFACASHLFWGFWAVLQSKYSPIEFDFLEYARLRFAGYYYHKARFCKAGKEITLAEANRMLMPQTRHSPPWCAAVAGAAVAGVAAAVYKLLRG